MEPFAEGEIHGMAPKTVFCALRPWQRPGLPEKLLPTDRWLLIADLLPLIVPIADFQCLAEKTPNLESDSPLA